MNTPAGWYPDPWSSGGVRWWDGNQWTAHASASATPPAGWYDDPTGHAARRWWDGTAWTADAPSPAQPISMVPREPTPTFPLVGAGFAIVGIAIGVLVSRTLGAWLADNVWGSPWFFILAFYVPIYATIAVVCVVASKRFGSGSLVADFGWTVYPSDLWRGPLVWIGSGAAAVAASIPWRHSQAVARTAHTIRHGYHHLGPVAVIELAFFAVVAAPLLEELAFRGLLLRAFSERFGTAWAVALQGMCFGAYHFVPGIGPANVPQMVSLAAIGSVFGVSAARWRRLGPSIIAHALFNVAFVISVVATH